MPIAPPAVAIHTAVLGCATKSIAHTIPITITAELKFFVIMRTPAAATAPTAKILNKTFLSLILAPALQIKIGIKIMIATLLNSAGWKDPSSGIEIHLLAP